MAAPTNETMQRVGLSPRQEKEAPAGNMCCNGYKPVAEHWMSETAAEEAVSKATLAELVEKANVLASTQATLAKTEADLEATVTELTETRASLATAHQELEAAGVMIQDLDAELNTTRESLYRRERQQAETRWNFAVKHEAAEQFSSRLKFQGEMRRQLLQRNIVQRDELIATVEAERQAQLMAAEERLAELNQHKEDMELKLAEVSSALASGAERLIVALQEDLEDAQADVALSGKVLTGGQHPRVERLKKRRANVAQEAAEVAAAKRLGAEAAVAAALVAQAKAQSASAASTTADSAEDLGAAKAATVPETEVMAAVAAQVVTDVLKKAGALCADSDAASPTDVILNPLAAPGNQDIDEAPPDGEAQ